MLKKAHQGNNKVVAEEKAVPRETCQRDSGAKRGLRALITCVMREREILEEILD